MEPFDEAEFWEQWVADAQAREAERKRLEALGEAGAGDGDPAAAGGTPPAGGGGDPAAGLAAAAAGQGAVSAGAVAAVAVVAAGESKSCQWSVKWYWRSMKY